MSSAFKVLSDSKRKNFLKNLDKAQPNHGFEINHVKVMEQDISFAKNIRCVECEDYSSVPHRFQTYLIGSNDDIQPVLHGDNPYTDNHFDKMGIVINQDNVADYLSFYYRFFVKGSDYLKPVTHCDDIDWNDDITPMVQQSLEKDLSNYPKISSKNDGFNVKMACIFQQSIMIVTFFVSEHGIVTIEDRQCLAEDLPIKKFP